jgi:hypothetical protein
MHRINRISLAAALVGGFALLGSACYVGASPEGGVVATSYYQPMYYNGAIVYYDSGGLPYYYSGGATVYVPSSYPGYHSYRTHYTSNRTHYNRWYSSRGHRYKTHRRGAQSRRGRAQPRGRGHGHAKPQGRDHRR